MKTVIWWVRRDLRLNDNQALSSALTNADRVVPAFVLDPKLMYSESVAPKRIAFLLGGLRSLSEGLRARGSRLILRRGDPPAELARLVGESGAEAIYAEEDFTPYAAQRDALVGRRLPLNLVGGPVVHPPGAVLKSDGNPYVVYSSFSRAWRALPPPQLADLTPAPDRLPECSQLESVAVPGGPTLSSSLPFAPGEREAERRLRDFTEGDEAPIYRYADLRDRVDADGTSGLSPYMHLGMLSSRQAVVAAMGAIAAAPDTESREAAETWLSELIWREFYVHVLCQFPHVRHQSFRPDLRAIPWVNDEEDFAAWKQGHTGYPVVDAAMRQLCQTGWIHNRVRMIVASFLVKDLLIDWRWGERHFGQCLVDGDVAANNGGWQWTAGTGPSAAPYFRVFNPVLQGKRYDPHGRFVRRWVPELESVPDRFVHEPWQMPSALQRSVGCLVGRDYPEPLVDHRWARERALAAYSRSGEKE